MMDENPETVTQDFHFETPVKRIHGFKPGDRVAIVNCEMAGAYGKVTESRPGCVARQVAIRAAGGPEGHCYTNCRLIHVQLMSKPEGAHAEFGREQSYWDWAWASDDPPTTLRFRIGEVTHVD